jgi:hypothetical protein
LADDVLVNRVSDLCVQCLHKRCEVCTQHDLHVEEISRRLRALVESEAPDIDCVVAEVEARFQAMATTNASLTYQIEDGIRTIMAVTRCISTQSERSEMDLPTALELLTVQKMRQRQANEVRAQCLHKREEHYLRMLSQVCEKLAGLLGEEYTPVSQKGIAEKRMQIIDNLSVQLKRLRRRMEECTNALAQKEREDEELRQAVTDAAVKMAEVFAVPLPGGISPVEAVVSMAAEMRARFDLETQKLNQQGEDHSSEVAAINHRLQGILGKECVQSTLAMLDLIQDEREAIERQNHSLRESRQTLRNCLLDVDAKLKSEESTMAGLSDATLVARIQEIFKLDVMILPM